MRVEFGKPRDGEIDRDELARPHDSGKRNHGGNKAKETAREQ